MAINPSAEYPGQIDITSDPTGYPFGAAQNDVVVGDGQGTPLERLWVKDLFGFFQALLSFAGLTPSGIPDKVGASQYLSALTSLGDARSKLALYKSQALNWPERASFHNANDYATPDGATCLAWAPTLGANGLGRYVAIEPHNVGGMQTWTSEDGTQFTFRGPRSAAHSEVAYGLIDGAPGFLLTYDSPVGCETSVNGGVSWTVVSNTMPTRGVPCYSASLGLWVVAGESGVIYTSPTALVGTWTLRGTPGGWVSGSGGVKRVVFANGLFVVLPKAVYGKFLTSPDGITWTERNHAIVAEWRGLAYSSVDGLWMATTQGTGLVVSVDGLTWSFQNTGRASNDLAVIGNTWVLPMVGGGVAWSVDKGSTWTNVAVGDHTVATAGWSRIIAADSRFAVMHATGAVCEVALSLRSL